MRKYLVVLFVLLSGALFAQVQIDQQSTETDEEEEGPLEPVDSYVIIKEANRIQQIVDDLNAERAKLGLTKLEYRSINQIPCNKWAKKIAKADKLTHSRQPGEVLAGSSLDPTDLIARFMSSFPHRKVLMRPKAKGVCIGLCQTPWVLKKTKNGDVAFFTPGVLYAVIRTYE